MIKKSLPAGIVNRVFCNGTEGSPFAISETENRLALASFPQDMVPETEGF